MWTTSLGSDASPEKVKEMTAGIDAILSKGKFTIKAWHSNSPGIDQDPNENPGSLLGHRWDKKADSIALKREAVNADLSYCTKRSWFGIPAVGPTSTDGTSLNSVQNRSPESMGGWLPVG